QNPESQDSQPSGDLKIANDHFRPMHVHASACSLCGPAFRHCLHGNPRAVLADLRAAEVGGSIHPADASVRRLPRKRRRPLSYSTQILKGMPPFGCSVIRATGDGRWSLASASRAFPRMVARIEVISIMANAIPMQMRGPAPKGMYW